MKFFKLGKSKLKPVLVIVLLAVMLGVVTSCEDYGFAPPSTPAEKSDSGPAPVVITTKDSAMLAVYEHLLDQAETYQAKIYLADFYTTSDNWSAVGEYFKDGSGVWYIQVDMTSVKLWQAPVHWQQASWYVFKDGKVIPSNFLNANALRIDADLLKLSLQAKAE